MSELSIIEGKLDEAGTFADIFGVGASLPEVKQRFRMMARALHPDRNPDSVEDANRVSAKLIQCYKDAMEAMGEGTYNRGRKKFELTSRLGTYLLGEIPHAEGDHSTIYRGFRSLDEVLVKVATRPTDNPFLQGESGLLTKKHKPAWYKFVPEIKDSFYLKQGDKRYQVNVMPYPKGYVTLREIHEVYPKGIDPRDAAWIFRRVLGGSMVAASIKRTHTALTMDHVLVHPTTHDPLYLGWGHTAIRGKKKHRGLDSAMAAKIFVKLAYSIPSEIQEILDKCLTEDKRERPSPDSVMTEFTRVIRKLWGKEYRPLNMPT